MNLDTLVVSGQPPWWPNPRVRSLDVWHEYDVPTVGLLDLAGRSVLVTAVGDTGDRLSVWAYTCVEAEEAKEFATREFASVDELWGFVYQRFDKHEVVLVLADNLKIRRWSPMTVKDGLVNAASDFLGDILRALEKKQDDPTVRFHASLAGVEAADELVDA